MDDFVSYTSRRYNLYAKVLPLKIYEQLSFKNSLDALLDTNSLGLQQIPCSRNFLGVWISQKLAVILILLPVEYFSSEERSIGRSVCLISTVLIDQLRLTC